LVVELMLHVVVTLAVTLKVAVALGWASAPVHGRQANAAAVNPMNVRFADMKGIK